MFEKEIEVSVPDSMLTEEALAEFSRTMWDIESEDDIFIYAATLMAREMEGLEHDGIGYLKGVSGMSAHDANPNVVTAQVIFDEADAEVDDLSDFDDIDEASEG